MRRVELFRHEAFESVLYVDRAASVVNDTAKLVLNAAPVALSFWFLSNLIVRDADVFRQVRTLAEVVSRDAAVSTSKFTLVLLFVHAAALRKGFQSEQLLALLAQEPDFRLLLSQRTPKVFGYPKVLSDERLVRLDERVENALEAVRIARWSLPL